MKRFTYRLLGVAALAVAACDQPPDYVTAEGQIGLALGEVDGEIIERPAEHVDIVVGSTICVEMQGWFTADGSEFHIRGEEEDDAWLRECFDLAAGPGATIDGACMTMDVAGETALEMTAKACELTDAEGPEFRDDRLPIAAHAIEDLVLTYEDPILRTIHLELDPGPADAFGPAPLRPVGEPLRVVADGSYTVFPQPALAVDPSRTIAFTGGTARAVTEFTLDSFTANLDGTAVIDLGLDQNARIALDLPAGSLTGDEIRGVDPATAVSMELVVGYQKCADCSTGYGAPSHAIAIVRDADGARLFGADVEFSLDGEAGNLSAAGAEGVVAFEDVCTDAEGDERSATLNASYGQLVASASLEYVCPEADDLQGWDVETVDDDQEDLDLDLFGCGCSTDDRGPGASALFAVVFVLAARRRRRR
jgi:MYXO-CTERM domain-containing protein